MSASFSVAMRSGATPKGPGRVDGRSSRWTAVCLAAGAWGCGASGFSVEGDPRGGPLDAAQAAEHVLGLVNRDRKAHGLPLVVWDEAAAAAGQRHAVDMATNGFTAHLGTDGSVPEQRYTDAGGSGMVMENVGCFADAVSRPLEENPEFEIEELERVHAAFMDEVPPFDGHRKNILTPWHTHFGVGLAKAQDLKVVCMAQELVDRYGAFEPLPRTAKVGDVIRVQGELIAPAEVGAVGIARAEPPSAIAAASLNKTGSYVIPKPYVTYFPKGFKTPIELEVSGRALSIEVPLDDAGRAGLYQVSVWARLPHDENLLMVSLRTIAVE